MNLLALKRCYFYWCSYNLQLIKLVS